MTADNPVVRDFVIPLDRYPHLQENSTLHDAVEKLLSFSCGENERLRYATLFVVNEQNELAGKVSLVDLLKALDKRLVDVPRAVGFEGKTAEYPNLTILWQDSFFIECGKKKDMLLKEIMSPVKRVVKAGDSLLMALSLLLHEDDQVLPVIDKDFILGFIRLEEIFKAICIRCKL